MHQVLQLDIQGTPQAWITHEDAALYYATESIAWEIGETPLTVMRGGWNVARSCQSELVISPIIALRGMPRRNLHEIVPCVTKAKLLKRDRFTCAYCADMFKEQDLQVEHIVPQSVGGAYSWLNLVAACPGCNGRKGARTPEQAGMPLVYLPYVPSKYEDFLLAGRNIRADVHEWLASKVPKGSRPT